jgi:hypothetical protein
VYAFAERLPHTRFAVQAQAYIDRLRSDAKYMSTLRELWKSRGMDVKKLPDAQALAKMLPAESAFDHANPITGVARSEQHDTGML